MDVVIQSACSDDAAPIAEVHVSALRAAYQGHLPDHLEHLVLGPPDVKRRARAWEGWLKRSRVSTLVAHVDGMLTGFCTLHPMRDEAGQEAAQGMTGEIPALFVLPSHWRRGIGRLLCGQMLAEARTRDFAEVALWVLESDERARCFYNSLGFRPDGGTRVFLERSDASLHELRYRRNTSLAAA